MEWTGLTEDVTSPILDDSTGEKAVIGKLTVMNDEWSMKAIHAAAAAWDGGQGDWPQMSLRDRVLAIEKYLSVLAEKRDEIVEVLMWEICKNSADAAKEFDRTVDFAREVIHAVRAGKNEEFQEWTTIGGIRARVRRGPVGVCLMLAPYNYPLNEMYAMMVPALLLGNVVVLKLPAIGALAHILTIDALRQALPKGVISFLTGSGRATLPPVMQSGKVDALGFIGGSKGADALVAAHSRPHRLKVSRPL